MHLKYWKLLGKNNLIPNWSNISWSQKLSEDYIREFQNKVDWIYISI